MNVSKQKNGFSVKAYQGDAKTLLAFNLPKTKARNLAGFTVQVRPDGQESFYLQNQLQFKDLSKHAQDAKLPPTSSFNAPIHKFRWVHVPGSLNQGTRPFFGPYTYTVTPRYFDDKGSLQPIDQTLSVALKVEVGPFAKGKIETGFTRGFTQSQAFVHHFGRNAVFRPKGKELLFDTSKVSGKNNLGQEYTFDEEYQWLGFTAREKIFALASEVLHNKKLHMDVFAYDLNEPDLMKILLELAKQGRIRMILDNAALHHSTNSTKSKSSTNAAKKPNGPKPEDQFEKLFTKSAKKPAEILRGKFGRFAHDKVLIVSRRNASTEDPSKNTPLKVLTGSTNFSVTGLYVNSNHILVFNEQKVAAAYAQIFQVVWDRHVKLSFNKSEEAKEVFSFSTDLPKTEITFSPHQEAEATENLDNLAARIAQEEKQDDGSVLFAVMGLDKGTGPVLPALRKLH